MYRAAFPEESSKIIRQDEAEVLRVILVDDSQGARKFLAPALRSQGLEVVGEASDGREGLALYENMRPDLVFLDIVMPIVSGLEVLRQIKEMDPDAIVVMLTSMADRESVLESKREGAFSYLLKPFNVGQIKQLIGEIRESLVQGGISNG